MSTLRELLSVYFYSRSFSGLCSAYQRRVREYAEEIAESDYSRLWIMALEECQSLAMEEQEHA